MGPTRWLGFLLNIAAERLKAQTAESLAPLGITPKELGALETLALSGPISQIELSRLILSDRTSVVHLVDRMTGAGLVVREPRAGDRRINSLVLTEKGQALLTQAQAAASAIEATFSAELSKEELQQLKRLLTQLTDSFGR